MKRTGIAAILASLFLLLPVHAAAEPLLVPVGQTVGLQLRDNTVTVAAFDDILGAEAKGAGLKIGDRITKVNGIPVNNTEEIREILDSSGEKTELTILRGSKEMKITLSTTKTEDGTKLGVYLKQGITGIGTVTWYDPATGKFGALGHGVMDSGGVLMKMAEGATFPAQVQAVNRGKCGRPGQLMGSCSSAASCGDLIRNTPQGVFGKTSQGWSGEPIPIAQPEQIHTGQASIRSTVQGSTARDYSVEILKVYSAERMDGRNLLLKVTDPALLEATGGIVQGMSGSPIIQDGKLVGAITHVLVNDPTTGYGIFIENMLDAAA